MLEGRVTLETGVVSAAQAKGNGAAKNAEAAKHDDCVDDIAYEDHEAAFRAYAANLQKDAEDQDDCAAHQHIHAKMEGIGANPERLVVFVGCFKEEYLHQHGLDVFQMIHMARFRPPVGFLHVAAAVGSARRPLVGYGIQFPTDVQWAGFDKFGYLADGQGNKAKDGQVPQKIEQGIHALLHWTDYGRLIRPALMNSGPLPELGRRPSLEDEALLSP